jgi:hypothetical protein
MPVGQMFFDQMLFGQIDFGQRTWRRTVIPILSTFLEFHFSDSFIGRNKSNFITWLMVRCNITLQSIPLFRSLEKIKIK